MIQYISYYGNEKCREKRAYTLSATNKMDYIASAMRACGENVEIVSMSQSTEGCAKSYTYTNDGVTVRMLASLNASNKLCRPCNRIWMRWQLFWHLLRQKKGAHILVYHSLGYMKTIALAKKIRKLRLILEVEEIYGDVIGNPKVVKRELSFFRLADRYIFPTQLLDEKINKEKKPSAIIHGTYQVEPDRKCNIFDDDLQSDGKRNIHCVYAGTFDPRKGGAAAAAAAAAFLPSNYHIHILGFGSEADTEAMKNKIEELSKHSSASVTYDGLLSGEEYIRFIQSCDIGLSTQNPDAAFNATSFPSKILSYMANGLRVVSIRIPAIENSAVGNCLYYYDRQTPEEIAKAIMAVNISDDYDGRKIISQLDERFQRELAALLEETG